jgi:DNA-directed RNA polymerase beta subunit
MLTKAEKTQELKTWLSTTKLDSEVVKHNLGIDASSVSPHVLLTASKKLIALNKQEAAPDDRDNLKFSKFLGMEDYVQEHILRDAGRVQQKAKTKMQAKKNLSWLTPGFFSSQIRSVIIGNTLANNVEGINPLEHYDNSHRVSKMGPGAIGSREAMPLESRQVNSSSFGFFDPVHIMEGDPGAANFISHNVAKGKDNKLYRVMKDKNGKLGWYDHEDILSRQAVIPEH